MPQTAHKSIVSLTAIKCAIVIQGNRFFSPKCVSELFLAERHSELGALLYLSRRQHIKIPQDKRFFSNKKALVRNCS